MLVVELQLREPQEKQIETFCKEQVSLLSRGHQRVSVFDRLSESSEHIAASINASPELACGNGTRLRGPHSTEA